MLSTRIFCLVAMLTSFCVMPVKSKQLHSNTHENTSLDLHLNLISQSKYPHAKCLDGTAPAYYWRSGVGSGEKSLILFFEGGGWCYPSDIQQPCSPPSSHCSANCHIRANLSVGTTKNDLPIMPPTGIEAGGGFLSGDPNRTAFANFSVAYLRYCDGGSFTGLNIEPDIALNGTGPLYYAGRHNLNAVLHDLVEVHGVDKFDHIIVSGCSAGGMACHLHCKSIASFFKGLNTAFDVRCICDAGMFIDVPTVTGAGNVMETRFFDIAERMGTKSGLDKICVEKESDWRHCLFSEKALEYNTDVPVFVINSLYNFGEWAMLPPPTSQSFPPDTVEAAADWLDCWPSTGGMTPQTYSHCNETQRSIINDYLVAFKRAVAPAIDPSLPHHGAWLDSCPSMHCQTDFASDVLVKGTAVGDAVADWYFNRTVVKLVDKPFPSNPTCH